MTEKKKICFVSLFAYGIFNPAANLKFGGSEVQLYFLAKRLAREEDLAISFIVLDLGQNKIENHDGVQVIKAYKRGGGIMNQITGFFKLISALRRANPDVIVCRAFGREVGVSALYAKFFGRKMVYCFANDNDGKGKFFHGLAGKIFRFGFKAADHYIAQSSEQAEVFKQTYPAKADKITIIKNGWPIKASPVMEREFILWVGSSSPLKRPEIFIRLAREFPREKFFMIMTKSKLDEKAHEELLEEVKSCGNLEIKESVPLQKIGEYFSRAKVLANTSSSEGFPNVFLQVAVARVPVLSLKVDPDNFIAKEKCGLVCHDDFGELKAGLEELLRDEDFRQQTAENGFNYLKANHDLEKNIPAWRNLFNNLTAT